MTTRHYYPLKPTGRRYKIENIAIVSICVNSEEKFITGELIQNIEGVWFAEDYTDPVKLIHAILETDNKTWFITYDIDFISSLFEATIQSFSSISGLGKDTTVLTLTNKKEKRYILDCRQYFLEPINKVSAILGIGLGDYPEDDTALDKWECYNQKRAVIIMLIWRNIEIFLASNFGVYPSKTPGATALKCWRSTIPSNVKARAPEIRHLTNYSLRAGALHWRPGFYSAAWHYDINAAYIAAMKTIDYPLHLQMFTGGNPPSNQWIATVVLSYKSNSDFSPLSSKISDGTTIHPTHVKRARLCITYLDYQLLYFSGEVEIHDWIEGVYWQPWQAYPVFRDWANIIETASMESNRAKFFLKVISRALHSKFAQIGGSEVTSIRKVKNQTIDKLINAGKVADIFMLSDGSLAVKTIKRERAKFKPFIIPDWEALTLAAGRMMLYNALDENTVYLDTDCIISTVPRPDLPLGIEFGSWKMQNTGPCVIAGPRMYAFPDKVKSAGIYTPDRHALETAIWQTARGKIAILEAYEKTGILGLDGIFEGHSNTRDHTIQQIVYPRSEITRATAYVTRSPTKQYKIKSPNRRITNDYPNPLRRIESEPKQDNNPDDTPT